MIGGLEWGVQGKGFEMAFLRLKVAAICNINAFKYDRLTKKPMAKRQDPHVANPIFGNPLPLCTQSCSVCFSPPRVRMCAYILLVDSMVPIRTFPVRCIRPLTRIETRSSG
jgi:hypothetical protein